MPTVSGNSSASLCAGRKADAEAKLTELLSAVAKGEFVKPSKLTVAEWVSQRVEAWVEAKEISGKTEEGYRRVVDHYIVPHLGNRTLQSLKPFDVDRWRTALRTMGLSARTIGGAHRVLGKALREAVKFDVVVKNVCSSPAGGQRAPSVRDEEEMAILTEPQIAAPVDALRNCHERRGHRGRPFQLGRTLFPKFIVALFTGLRRGELLALRWGDVDLDARMLKVQQALEQTKKYGLRVKVVKTRAGRRSITLPEIVVQALAEHRREQLEVRVRLGLGRITDDALVFPALDGGFQRPDNLSTDWREFLRATKGPDVRLHALRHTHARMLIAARVDIVEISKRLGHADPSITFKVYAHLFRSDDSHSAQAINATLTRLGKA